MRQAQRVNLVREELSGRIDESNKRIDSVRKELTERLNSLFVVIVKQEKHTELSFRLKKLEDEVQKIKLKIAV
jgi:tetrahydromethanopterin S-methyltransferase subunit G